MAGEDDDMISLFSNQNCIRIGYGVKIRRSPSMCIVRRQRFDNCMTEYCIYFSIIKESQQNKLILFLSFTMQFLVKSYLYLLIIRALLMMSNLLESSIIGTQRWLTERRMVLGKRP